MLGGFELVAWRHLAITVQLSTCSFVLPTLICKNVSSSFERGRYGDRDANDPQAHGGIVQAYTTVTRNLKGC